jgi:hypothetical protein
LFSLFNKQNYLFVEKQEVNLQNNLATTEAADGPPAKQPKLTVGTARSGIENGENATGENVNRSFEKIMGLVQMDIPRYKHENNLSNFLLSV